MQLASQALFNQSKQQVAAIRKGLGQIVPLDSLCLFTWKEVETLVCGNPDVDVELLKRTCDYDGLSKTDPRVTFFWAAFERFTEQQRRDFLSYTWGRTRLLPAALMERSRGSDYACLKLSPGESGDNADLALPIVHTCFFQMELPNYSSADIAYERILYAIDMCGGYMGIG